MLVLERGRRSPKAVLHFSRLSEGLIPGASSFRYLVTVTNSDDEVLRRFLRPAPMKEMQRSLRFKRSWGTGLFKVKVELVGRDANGAGVHLGDVSEGFVEIR